MWRSLGPSSAPSSRPSATLQIHFGPVSRSNRSARLCLSAFTRRASQRPPVGHISSVENHGNAIPPSRHTFRLFSRLRPLRWRRLIPQLLFTPSEKMPPVRIHPRWSSSRSRNPRRCWCWPGRFGHPPKPAEFQLRDQTKTPKCLNI